MTQKNHPVVDKYNLRTYYNKFDNQRCALSGQDVNKGVRVANVAPLMTVLNALGMISTKVFKYARIALLPMFATKQETTLIRTAAEHLLSLTDPEWPKDHMGCSASSYHPLNNWMNNDCHELGTQRAAQALLQHVGTQIAKDSPEAKAIKTVADRRWNENRPKAKREPDTTCDEGYVVREFRARGEMLIDAPTKTGALVGINPWENEDHGAVKDALKAIGAKWDGAKKMWAVALTALAIALKSDSLNLTKNTPVVVTPRALDALRAAQEKSEATPSPKADETVDLGDRKATVRHTRTRRPGEVVLDANGVGLKVLFDFPNTDKLESLKNNVKSFGGRWDPKAKCWKLGANTTAENLHIFDDHKLVVTPAAIKAMQDVFERRSLSAAMDLDDEDLKKAINAVVPKGKTLFPFQAAGVAFLEKSGGCALIGDEMGTGKTVQTATFLAYRKDLRPAVIVVPAVVATNWVKELQAWTEGENIHRIKNGKDTIPADTTIIVTTYDLVKQPQTKEDRKDKKAIEARKDIKALNPQCVVADECHYLKNEKAQRTVAFKDLAHHNTVKSLILLSGTPIVNRPKEFFNSLNLLRPEEFSSWFKYTERYCGGHYSEYGYKADGVTNTEELASRLKDVMIRRLKADVLEDLPAKLRGRVTVDIASKARTAYKKAVNAADTTLTKITAGRHALGLAKVAPAVDLVNEYADQGKPLLLFAHHKDVLDGLCKALVASGISYGRIDGSVSHERRGQLVDSFQAGNLEVMVLSTKAAGVGITLTNATDVLFVERSWTPADEEQAEDRAHRIGQTGSVTVRYMVVPNSLDEDMDDLIESKRTVLHAVLDQGKMLEENEDLDIRSALIARMESQNKKGKKNAS